MTHTDEQVAMLSKWIVENAGHSARVNILTVASELQIAIAAMPAPDAQAMTVVEAAQWARNRLERIADDSWHGDERDLKRSLIGVFADFDAALSAAGSSIPEHLRRAETLIDQPAPAPVSAEDRENIVDEIESIINETHEMDVRDIDYAENIVSWLERHHPAALRALTKTDGGEG
ncbi:hypothetical protein ACFQFQ_14495 [Sulfitobacter porphyrae]|uniref:Uncharacterized protein n=1 Tax=Sulfitobacter porphyrae TaxID=1246864 RepID=A0ABW2B5H7_9RHOB|nr:hypothetical protein GCM10007928_02010 [Sulfitobacter porphyrae]